MRLPPRRFTNSDGMILIAMVAVWLSLADFWSRELAVGMPSFVPAAVLRTRVAGRGMSALVPWTVAVLVLRLHGPRPRLWVLARQPGTVACGVAVVMMVVEGASLPLTLTTMGNLTSPLLVAAWYWPTSVGAGVAASWLILAMRGRCCIGPDWIDQLGTLVGLCWITLTPALAVVEFTR